VQRKTISIEGMSKEEKKKKRMSDAGSSTTRGTTKEGAGMLHLEKCAEE